MFEILDLYGIPPPIIDAIRAIYTESESCILTPDSMTDFFAISSGILQGGTLVNTCTYSYSDSNHRSTISRRGVVAKHW